MPSAMRPPFVLLLLTPLLAAPVYGQGTPGDATSTAATPASSTAATALAVSNPADKLAYVLGSGDQILVRIFGADDMPANPVEIGPDGNATLPMVGKVQAAGLSVRGLEQGLTAKYAKFFRDPQVSVSVTDYRSEPVTVVGSVNLPNVIELRGPTRLMQAISLAGGLRPDAGDRVMISREAAIRQTSAPGDLQVKVSATEVDLSKIIDGTDPQANILVQKGDVITVPKAKMVYVVGDVAKPGGYVLDGHVSSLSVLQAIALAGGTTRTSATKKSRILISAGPDAPRSDKPVDISKILENKAPDVALHADDILFVPISGTKNAEVRALEAAVNIGTGIAVWR